MHLFQLMLMTKTNRIPSNYEKHPVIPINSYNGRHYNYRYLTYFQNDRGIELTIHQIFSVSVKIEYSIPMIENRYQRLPTIKYIAETRTKIEMNFLTSVQKTLQNTNNQILWGLAVRVQRFYFIFLSKLLK